MTRPLRRAHLGIWLVLTLLLYTLFAAGLAARREPAPRNRNLHWEQYR